jgi:ArsR family transcriptional regulator, lead/cadmium/zinc/bismuth-responsive transcriptional repressor
VSSLCTGDERPSTGPLLDERELEMAARMFRAIGDLERLRLIVLLARGPACVTELATAEGETLSTISQRLRVLRTENLIVRERHGKHIHYKLADRHIAEVIANVMEHAGEHGR